MRLRPRRLVLVGSVLVDILLYVERLPERGGDALARSSLITSGGGFNVLVAAARLGLRSAFAGRVGDGPLGRQVQADLAAAAIATMLPASEGDGDSGFDVGLVEAGGERTFVTSPGVESRLRAEDLGSLALEAGDAVYVSGYDLCYPISGSALESWLPDLRADRLLVFDPGPLATEIPPARLEAVLLRTDLLSLNAREAELLFGGGPEHALEAAPARLNAQALVVVRVGSSGCHIGGSGLEPRLLAGRPARAVDSTGAGDTHVGAFLARLAAGDDPYAAALAANVAASLAVLREGPATGPTATELEEALGA